MMWAQSSQKSIYAVWILVDQEPFTTCVCVIEPLFGDIWTAPNRYQARAYIDFPRNRLSKIITPPFKPEELERVKEEILDAYTSK